MEVKDLYEHLCLKKGLWMELVFKIMIYIINMTDFIWSYIFTCLEAIIERMSKLRSVRYMYVFLLGLNGCGCYKYENTSEKTNKNKKFNVKNWYFFLINTFVEVKIWVNDLQSQIRKSAKVQPPSHISVFRTKMQPLHNDTIRLYTVFTMGKPFNPYMIFLISL